MNSLGKETFLMEYCFHIKVNSKDIRDEIYILSGYKLKQIITLVS